MFAGMFEKRNDPMVPIDIPFPSAAIAAFLSLIAVPPSQRQVQIMDVSTAYFLGDLLEVFETATDLPAIGASTCDKAVAAYPFGLLRLTSDRQNLGLARLALNQISPMHWPNLEVFKEESDQLRPEWQLALLRDSLIMKKNGDVVVGREWRGFGDSFQPYQVSTDLQVEMPI